MKQQFMNQLQTPQHKPVQQIKLRFENQMVSVRLAQRRQIGVRAKEFRLQVLANWGDLAFVGLTGLDFLDKMGMRLVPKHVTGPYGTNRLI